MNHEHSCANDAAELGERAFNPWRNPTSEAAIALVDEIVDRLYDHEKRHCARQRQRRPNDQIVCERAVQAIVCDLAVNSLRESGTGVYLPRSNRHLGTKTRYNHPANTRQLPAILDTLSSHDLGVMKQMIGGELESGKRRRTVAWPGPYLADLMLASGVEADDFAVAQGGETIVLKRSRRDFWDEGGYVEYDETELTTALRSQLNVINSWLQRGRIALQPRATVAPDLSDRQLRRIFTQGRFDSGGRLFGGFWQPMKKDDRLKSLTIDGERVLEVDYGQIMPRLVYGMCGVRPRMQDLYAIPGYEAFRAGIKKVMCSMLFNEERLTQMPKGTREYFPRKVSIRDIVTAIEATHPAIKGAFGRGIGHRCQYTESQILTSVLLRLMEHGITALPIHDAVIIPASAADITQAVMLEVFHEQTGAEGIVEVVGR